MLAPSHPALDTCPKRGLPTTRCGRGRPNPDPNPWRPRPPSHSHEAPPATWRLITRMKSWRPRPPGNPLHAAAGPPQNTAAAAFPGVLLGGRGRAKKKNPACGRPPRRRRGGQPARSAWWPSRHKGRTGEGLPGLRHMAKAKTSPPLLSEAPPAFPFLWPPFDVQAAA